MRVQGLLEIFGYFLLVLIGVELRMTGRVTAPTAGGHTMSHPRRCGAITPRNSLELMILVLFQKLGKWRWLPVIK